jgi:AraC-like DNA-binding protein
MEGGGTSDRADRADRANREQRQRLVSVLDELAVEEGLNETRWPGCTVYRFTEPVPPHSDEVSSLALCMVAQGRKIVTIDGTTYAYDPYSYLVMTRPLRIGVEVLEASPEKPFLSLVLQVPSALVGEVLVELHTTSTLQEPVDPPQNVPDAFVSAMEEPLADATNRFLRAMGHDDQRRILCPMILREIVFHLLQHKQAARLRSAAIHENSSHQVLAAIRYMERNLEQRLDIATIARAVGMSPSSFAHSFKVVTTVSPIQFLKRLRLKRARNLILREGCAASEAAFMVGYVSPSQFSREFKRHYGEPPSSYLRQFRDIETINV